MPMQFPGGPPPPVMGPEFGMEGVDPNTAPLPDHVLNPQPDFDERTVLEKIMAASELAKQGMMQEAKQLYDGAMMQAQQLKQQPMVQEGIGMMQQVPGMAEGAMQQVPGMAEDAMQRGAGMAEDAYGAVQGLFK